MNTIKELCGFLWEIEKEYDLLDWETKGIHYWEINRVKIYYELATKLGIMDSPIKLRSRKKSKISTIQKILKNIINFPFFSTKKETLVFTHPRSKFVDNRYIDIYTKDIIDDLSNNKIDFLEMEASYNGKYLRNNNKRKRYIDSVGYFVRLMKLLDRRVVYDKKVSIINKIIFKKTGVDLRLEERFSNEIKKSIYTYYYFKALSFFIKPKKVYIVTAYFNKEIIRAFKEQGAKIIEIQHGVVNKYHLGYSYPFNNQNKRYQPNIFLTWNKTWKENFDYRVEKVDIMKESFLSNGLKKYKDVQKKQKQMVVLSQTAISNEIAEKIYKNIDFFKDFQIKYKLHPHEYETWEQNRYLKKLSNLNNFEILKDVDLHFLLAVSEYQLGVFSTAIYEGLEFGCKTFLLKATGIEYMEDIIEKRDMVLKNDFIYCEAKNVGEKYEDVN